MAAIKVEIAKLADKSVIVPPLLVTYSLMNLFSMPPVTYPVGDIKGDLSRPETAKGKGKDIGSESEHHEEILSEDRRRLKKARGESEKVAKEKKALDLAQRDAIRYGASTSGLPTLVDSSHSDIIPASE
ncbi:hypothetical protein RDI58_003890 [Solanum bulbocastanum]|uniref:Uncharacterized protein n=1 Tax=Solanum bulbocastanum TaxID=147425 RepID=A0AAN8U0H8_SOLBU